MNTENEGAAGTETTTAQGGQWMPLRQALALVEQHRHAGRLAEAAHLCQQILKARPGEPMTLHMLAIVNHQAGNGGAAVELMRRAIAADGSVALFHCNLCEMARLAGSLEEALAAGQRAVELRPDYAEAHNNLGIVHYERDELEQAVACYEKAIALRPDFAHAYSNLGNALRAQSRFTEAVPLYQRAIELSPDYADAHANLGTTLQMLGRRAEAMESFDRALALNPAQANAHSGRSLIQLLEGRYEEGWPEYEWRWRSRDVPARRPPGRPWRGEELGGKRILVYAEQGYGDTIQFCRYLPLLRDRGAIPILRLPARLDSLIADSMPWLETSSEAGALPAYDFHAALMSLPGILGTRVDTIPADIPYLLAEPGASARCEERIGDDGRLKVGLAWSGNPKHVNNLYRSLHADQLAPLLGVGGARFFSLQVGQGADEAAGLPAGSITILGEEILTPFAAAAALMENLDLVISIDSSAAHLAGALGRPVWILLSSVPDWRWMLEREDNPWYPTARLFRQQTPGQWEDVVSRAAEELQAVVAGDRGRLAPRSLQTSQ